MPEPMDMQHLVATPLSLIVVAKTNHRYKARHIPISGSVEEYLSDAITETLAKLDTGTSHRYDPDGNQDGADYLVVDPGDVLDERLLQEVSKRPSVLDIATNADAGKELFCYVVRAESSEDESIPYLFIRKQNPVQLIGKRLFRFNGGALETLNDSIFRLEGDFDVIVHGESVVALNFDRFERLFSDSQAVLARVSDWISDAFTTLPLSPDVSEYLLGLGKGNRFYRKKIQSLARRNYMRTMTIEYLLERASQHESLDSSSWVIDGQLQITKDNQKVLIGYLNEDIYRGEFSQDMHQASSKSPVQSGG